MRIERESNIELLRILTMMGVIILHYNNPRIGGGIAYANGNNRLILYFLDSIFVCAVDLFILISGYFMCKNPARNFIKPLELLAQVVFFNFTIYFTKVVFGREELSITDVLKNFIPSNWFVILYIALYLVSPAINFMVDIAIEKNMLGKIVLIAVLLFSVYPTCVDVLCEILGRDIKGLSSIGLYGSQWGYSIVNFSLMYLLGAYIRNKKIVNRSYWIRLLGILFLSGLLTGWACLNDIIGFGTERSAWEYCNPIVILIAIELFLMFKSFKIGVIKAINELGKGAFTVFLLHINFLSVIKIEYFVSGSCTIMIGHIFVSVISIYVICWCIFKGYEFIARPIWNIIKMNIPILIQDFYEGA